MNKNRLNLLLAALTFGGAIAGATVKMPGYISDNMIVQQNSVLTLAGEAAPGSKVTVLAGWERRPLQVTADAGGRFEAKVKTPAAGGPYTLTISDSDGEVRFENLLSGEVWLCSGQSNMEFPVKGWTTVMDYDREVATSYHPDIRLLQVRKTTAFSPQETPEVNAGGWNTCNSESMADFSAIAYFFARELQKELKVPVGVIDCTWGGTPAEAWTSYEALKGVPGFEAELADLQEADFDRERLESIYNRKIGEWMKLATTSRKEFDKGTMQSGADWKSITMPGYWEQSELPGFDGIVWLQKSFNLPAEAAGKELKLRFRAIDDEDVVYLNGSRVGSGAGFDTPREYTVAESVVRPGENVITIRVSDFGGEGGIAPGVAEAVVDGKSYPLAGEWNYMIDSNFAELPAKPTAPQGSSYPSVLYNAMLSPLKNMPVKGVLWYQGCANVGRAEQYEPLFQSLICDWRQLWGENLPFYFVQLAGWLRQRPVQPDSEWAALRNAQAKALSLPNTAMATAIDLGNPADIHPQDKQDVAHRLALIALNRDYGHGELTYAAPKVVDVKREKNAIVLTFDGKVEPTSVAITGFIVGDEKGNFTTGTPVQTSDNEIRVEAAGMRHPTCVRYNWADFPCGNLYGTTGLPVAPFATDK